MQNVNNVCDHKSLNVIKNKLNMESRIITDNGDYVLKVFLNDGFLVVLRDDSDFEKGRPFNASLMYDETPIYNVSTDTLEDCILLIKDMDKIANGLILLGYDDEYDVKNLSKEVSHMIERRISIHNLLVDATFKIGNEDSVKTLNSMGIDVNDYVIKNKSFMNKKTKKFVTTY